MLKRTLPVALIGLLTAPSALAETPFYGGLNVGLTTISVDNPRADISAEGFGFKLYGGFRFSEKTAFEFGYNDLGSFDDVAGGVSFDYEASGYSGYFVRRYAVNDTMSILAKAGLMYYEAKFSARDGMTRTNGKDDRTVGALAIGGEHIRNDRLTFRAELEWLDLDTVDTALFFNFGINYGFGGGDSQ